MSKSYLVTGGTGFLGSALVRRLVQDGHRVRVLDNNSRGRTDRLHDLAGSFEFVKGDIRNATIVDEACRDIDSVCHLAYINGTEFFYTKPNLVLEVGVTGMMNVLSGSIKHGVSELVLASTSEVYQSPPVVPTDESVGLSIPDPLNPRYSYAGGKIISEILAVNYGRQYFKRVLIFRPHNVYGPDMGWEHVVPELVLRMRELVRNSSVDPIPFPIQGTGTQTRSFVYIDDFIDGLRLMMEHGEHLGIYHLGTDEELSIQAVAAAVGRYFGKEITIVPSEAKLGGTQRRCPDITKISRLGYRTRVPFNQGLPITAQWYDENAHLKPSTD